MLSALLAITLACAVPAAVSEEFSHPGGEQANPVPHAETYRAAVETCLDRLLEYGTDRYGPVHTPMLMSIVDVRTNESPPVPEELDGAIRTEGRAHRRNPGGCDLWDDQPLLRTLYAWAEWSGTPRYAQAADDYIKSYLARSTKPNGLIAWGTHIYYDAYKDAPGGDQEGAGPHEILVLCPMWERMWAVAPEAVRQEIDGLWEWHILDPESGLHNRHDDKQPGCDFAFSGGEFGYAFAFLYSRTRDPEHLRRAKVIFGRHWNTRNTETNLAPDAPGTGDRYDATHCFTTLSGPHAALLLKSWEATGDPWFRDLAYSHIAAWDKHAWDTSAGQFHAMLTLDGRPIPEEPRGPGYDAWKPTGYIDTWRATMYSYEFPDIAAQCAAWAAEITGGEAARVAAGHWYESLRGSLPPNPGRRWGPELRKALPGLREGDTYAENYGRAMSFLLRVHRLTGDPQPLADAVALADNALARLQVNGWIKGHPAKPYYETADGVAYFLYALMELACFPEALPPNL